MLKINLLRKYKFYNKISFKYFSFVKEPEEYRTFFIENLPHDWELDEIKVRLQQLGTIEKINVIKNSIGENTGKVIATYDKIESVSQAINAFKNKTPLFKPLKIRFYRKFEFAKHKIRQNLIENNEVLIIKNLPQELRKEDLDLFLQEFAKPIYIAYPRDYNDEFKKMAFVYFKNSDDATKVLNYANLRYVKNKQLYMKYASNSLDITDFRTRIELDIKLLDPLLELKYFNIQKQKLLKNSNNVSDKDKIEYLNTQIRKLEYKLGKVSSNNLLETDNADIKDTEIVKI